VNGYGSSYRPCTQIYTGAAAFRRILPFLTGSFGLLSAGYWYEAYRAKKGTKKDKKGDRFIFPSLFGK
jgi:hypothetical protein